MYNQTSHDTRVAYKKMYKEKNKTQTTIFIETARSKFINYGSNNKLTILNIL